MDGGRQMGEAVWELVPGQGIKRGAAELFFGKQRSEVHAMLKEIFGAPEKTNFPDEDDFRMEDGTFIRVRFNDAGLQDVEFLGGELRLGGLRLHEGATWEELEPELEARGYEFTNASVLGDGYECTKLGVNIATHDDIGGDGDGIEWVIASVNIK
jgi:hypothetical protein